MIETGDSPAGRDRCPVERAYQPGPDPVMVRCSLPAGHIHPVGLGTVWHFADGRPHRACWPHAQDHCAAFTAAQTMDGPVRVWCGLPPRHDPPEAHQGMCHQWPKRWTAPRPVG